MMNTTISLSVSDDQGVTLSLNNAASYCHVLDAPHLEGSIDDGAWLILIFTNWIPLDYACAKTSIRVVEKFGGEVSLGLHLQHDYEDVLDWWPQVGSTYWTPLWLLFFKRNFVARRDGLLLEDDATNWVRCALNNFE